MTRLVWLVRGSGAVLGAILGYVYYAKVGCISGHCMIWSNPWIATGYGAVLGYLLISLIPIGKRSSETTNPSS